MICHLSSTARTNTNTKGLEYRDVFVLCDPGGVSESSGLITGLTRAGFPVRLMTDDDAEDVAGSCSDVVWVASGHRVRGLERKVVACVQDGARLHQTYHRLLYMSRCTSQLLLVVKP